MIWLLFYGPWLATCQNKRLGFAVTTAFVAIHYSVHSESNLRNFMKITLNKWTTNTSKFFSGKTKWPTCLTWNTNRSEKPQSEMYSQSSAGS